MKTSTPETPVLRCFSFALNTYIALRVFWSSKLATYFDSKQLDRNKKNSISRVFRSRELSLSDSDCYIFTRNSFLQSRTLMQARFATGVANSSVLEFKESFESTLHCKNATSISYDGKDYFAGFGNGLLRKGATLHCADKETPCDWMLSFLRCQRFFDFKLQRSSSRVSFATRFGIMFRIVDAMPWYFTFKLGNKASLPFRFFSASWDTSFSRRLWDFGSLLGAHERMLLEVLFSPPKLVSLLVRKRGHFPRIGYAFWSSLENWLARSCREPHHQNVLIKNLQAELLNCLTWTR